MYSISVEVRSKFLNNNTVDITIDDVYSTIAELTPFKDVHLKIIHGVLDNAVKKTISSTIDDDTLMMTYEVPKQKLVITFNKKSNLKEAPITLHEPIVDNSGNVHTYLSRMESTLEPSIVATVKLIGNEK